MASIKVNKKKGKIVSFKLRVFIGRDDEGKQQFKTKYGIFAYGILLKWSIGISLDTFERPYKE